MTLLRPSSIDILPIYAQFHRYSHHVNTVLHSPLFALIPYTPLFMWLWYFSTTIRLLWNDGREEATIITGLAETQHTCRKKEMKKHLSRKCLRWSIISEADKFIGLSLIVYIHTLSLSYPFLLCIIIILFNNETKYIRLRVRANLNS